MPPDLEHHLALRVGDVALDLADLARAKFDFDVVGHYARPDVFRLEVNERPMKSVKFQQDPHAP